MRKAVVLAATLLAASLGVSAQTNSSSGDDDGGRSSITVTGCLAAPGPGGEYVLIEASGVSYRLEDRTSSLPPGIGKVVQISGQLAHQANTSGDTSGAPSANHASDANRTIQVSEVRLVSDQCPPVAKIQAESANERLQARVNPSNAPPGENPGNAPRAGDGGAKVKQLPQTSTILPLLGLIGLGSLIAGFFARK